MSITVTGLTCNPFRASDVQINGYCNNNFKISKNGDVQILRGHKY